MIKKFKMINNMAVFRDFQWDDSVLDFSKVNVIYGRNYSGKTTLSRMIRAFETGCLSDKYSSPSFSLETDDATYTEKDCSSKKLLVRVFNEDFIHENLRFVVDPEKTIAPFAILGKDNDQIEKEIEDIRKILGSAVVGSETGFYRKQADANTEYADAKQQHLDAKKDLNKKMKEIATNAETGIKYCSEKYGDQNYNTSKLKSDIDEICSSGYIRPSEDEMSDYENRIKEKAMSPPKDISDMGLSIDKLSDTVKEICTRKVGQSQRIQELIADIALQEWVHQGLELNKKRKNCAFCGSPLTDMRWNDLASHFNKESESLRSDIDACLHDIDSEEERVQNVFQPQRNEFYTSFTADIDSLVNEYLVFLDGYKKALEDLRILLRMRKDSIYTSVPYSFNMPNMSAYRGFLTRYSDLREENIKHTKTLDSSKKEAHYKLRLAKVDSWMKDIEYKECVKHIDELKKKEDIAKSKLDTLNSEINDRLSEIDSLKHKQNDEKEGANKINELLKRHFGHSYISIVPKKSDDENGTNIYFEVIRKEEKAFHLSEGEKSLIAFCYFIAKLKDVETDGKKPIIWIDDPISSLDENHIYYVYSLITHEILQQDNYEQLFISTHNLLFLKYLRRLDIKNHKSNKSRKNFMVDRRGECSAIVLMPNYLAEHGTEFNRWFENIYFCNGSNARTDENYYRYENFGNNARKFFETYLYYRYPDGEKFEKQLKRFFGDESVPPILIRKLENENSHAGGDLENHSLPFDEPEITEAAKLILKRLEEIDKDQYDALVKSIEKS